MPPSSPTLGDVGLFNSLNTILYRGGLGVFMSPARWVLSPILFGCVAMAHLYPKNPPLYSLSVHLIRVGGSNEYTQPPAPH